VSNWPAERMVRMLGSAFTRLLPIDRAASAANLRSRSRSYDLASRFALDAMKIEDIASAAMAMTKMSTKTSAMPRRGRGVLRSLPRRVGEGWMIDMGVS